ncbi:hypothetical protein ACFL6U_08630 [Planctomycetota bacterium]
MTPDGKKLFVANFLPAGRGDGDYAAATVTVIDTTEKKSCATVTLPNGSIDLRGITVSPDGQYVYVTHVLARYQMPTTHLDRGWMNTNALSILKTSDNSLLTTVLLDEVDQGVANPWGVACTADGDYLCVAHSGSHELSVIDRVTLHKKIHQVSLGQKVSDALNWDLMNDGIGNPKNTKSLLLSHATPPAMAGGARNSAEDAVRSGIRFIQFAHRPDEDARAIDAYLKSLTPIPSPYLVKGRSSPTELSQTARRGKQLFVRAGCASCHPGSLSQIQRPGHSR